MNNKKDIKNVGVLFALLGSLLLGTGCSQPSETSEDSSGGHYHAAPHGGSLVMLGNHIAQLELVPGERPGEWIFYILDGGAERFVRIEQEAIEVTMDGKEAVFQATANSATGETVGDTAQFTAKVEGLSGESRFPVLINEIVVFRQPFSQVEFNFPEGKH
ncbi:MAG TPA: hypothetical protein DDY45_05220 [Verrucomicrobiales bacterium]|nr:hypothetical protein [Verrucomicrobiales bacterium]